MEVSPCTKGGYGENSDASPICTLCTVPSEVERLQGFKGYIFPKGRGWFAATGAKHCWASRQRHARLGTRSAGLAGRRRSASRCLMSSGRLLVVKDRAVRRWSKRIASGWRVRFLFADRSLSPKRIRCTGTGRQAHWALMLYSVPDFTSSVKPKSVAGGRKVRRTKDESRRGDTNSRPRASAGKLRVA
jgi:hypothetical protein